MTGWTLLANEGDPVDKQRYQALIGSLTYAVTARDACTSLGQEGQCWCGGQIVEFFY